MNIKSVNKADKRYYTWLVLLIGGIIGILICITIQQIITYQNNEEPVWETIWLLLGSNLTLSVLLISEYITKLYFIKVAIYTDRED